MNLLSMDIAIEYNNQGVNVALYHKQRQFPNSLREGAL
jgi:hypothetical protein